MRKDLNIQEFTAMESEPKDSPTKPEPRPWTTVQSNRRHQKQTARISRDRRLILTVPLDFLDTFNPKHLKDSINDEFLRMGKEKAVVAGITKSV